MYLYACGVGIIQLILLGAWILRRGPSVVTDLQFRVLVHKRYRSVSILGTSAYSEWNVDTSKLSPRNSNLGERDSVYGFDGTPGALGTDVPGLSFHARLWRYFSAMRFQRADYHVSGTYTR